MGPAYRVRQFLAAVRPSPVRPNGTWEVLLTPRERALFARLPMPYREHSLRVLSRLQAAGHTDGHLLVAALLHDAGKAEAGIGVVHRVVTVLTQRFAPQLMGWLAADVRRGDWRYPFFVQRRHAALGAAMAKAEGTAAVAVDLIARHHDAPRPGEDARLRALRDADERE